MKKIVISSLLAIGLGIGVILVPTHKVEAGLTGGWCPVEISQTGGCRGGYYIVCTSKQVPIMKSDGSFYCSYTVDCVSIGECQNVASTPNDQ